MSQCSGAGLSDQYIIETIAIYIAKAVTGLRVSQEVEYEGLDLGEHGERAYNP